MLQRRQAMLQRVRQFFAEQQVLEVETPLLQPVPVSDPFIESVVAGQGYLHTSPEYAMKRLLAAGMGDIWQYCKVFRANEHGHRHLTEFSMIEWYRLGFDLPMLTAEVVDLIRTATQQPVQAVTRSYQDWFALATGGLNPHQASLPDLQALAKQWTDAPLDRDACLDIIMTHQVEPMFDPQVVSVVTHYPASQAALAKRVQDIHGQSVGLRFECYWQGLELANGYDELLDSDEQRQRFADDNQLRREHGLPEVAVDDALLAALSAGMPNCAGVALGFDRLLMAATGAASIDQVVSFRP